MASTYPSPASIKTPNVGNVTSVQVAPANPSRTSLYVYNPSGNTIWLSPGLSTDQTALVALASGIGSIPLATNTAQSFPGWTGAMNAIAGAGGTNVLTILEYYL